MERETDNFLRKMSEAEDVELAQLYASLDSAKENYALRIKNVGDWVQQSFFADSNDFDTARNLAHNALDGLLDNIDGISEKILLRSPTASIERQLEELYYIMKNIDMWRMKSHAEAITGQSVEIYPPEASVQDFVDIHAGKVSEGSSAKTDNLEELQESLLNAYEHRAWNDLQLYLQAVESERELAQDLDGTRYY